MLHLNINGQKTEKLGQTLLTIQFLRADRTVSVRIGANGTTLAGSSSQYTFTTDTYTADRSYISISNVKVLAYSSAQSDNESASKSIDGNINTIWHTTYTTNSDLNRFIAYEFNKPVLLTSIDYTPRQTGNFNGVFYKMF